MYSIVLVLCLVICVYAADDKWHGKLNKCTHEVEPIGCYSENVNHRALSRQLLNGRDRSSTEYEAPFLNWKTYGDWLPEFICRCAKKAYKLGYKIIGVQHYGECWVGDDAEDKYAVNSESNACMNATFQQLQKRSKSQCHAMVGGSATNYIYRIAPTECDTYYKPVGCYKDLQKPTRPLPNYQKDPPSANLIKWWEWNTSFSPRMICRCAEKAKSIGHPMFALQFWGECWTSNATDTYDIDGASDECRGKDFSDCACNSYHCVGMNKANNVYQLASNPVDP